MYSYDKSEFEKIMLTLIKWSYYIKNNDIIITNGFMRQLYGKIINDKYTSEYDIIKLYNEFYILVEFLNLNYILINWSWMGYFLGDKDDIIITFTLISQSIVTQKNCTIYDIIDYIKQKLQITPKVVIY